MREGRQVPCLRPFFSLSSRPRLGGFLLACEREGAVGMSASRRCGSVMYAYAYAYDRAIDRLQCWSRLAALCCRRALRLHDVVLLFSHAPFDMTKKIPKVRVYLR